MKVVILGCGRVGAALAKQMAGEGHDVTIIDRDTGAFRRLGPRFKGTKVVGPGTDIDVLRRAGVEGADAFFFRHRRGQPQHHGRPDRQKRFQRAARPYPLYDPNRAQAYQEMGIQTICTTAIATGLLHDMALGKSDDDLLRRYLREPGAAVDVLTNPAPPTAGAATAAGHQ
jgi:trk system potassium uptake protein TrkA